MKDAFGAEFLAEITESRFGCGCWDSTYEGRAERWYFGMDYLDK